ncbi:MAG TPA: hypothetical protein VFW07_25700 [Parafilimonas sp.]|nr:hypothetical protein [Parafilimonas sp.]
MRRNISMNADNKLCTCHNSGKESDQSLVKDLKKKKVITRYVEFVKMLTPAVIFAIIPKCPVCLAGYIALGTGLGLSITTATYVRIILIILCILSLLYFVIKHVRRAINE